MGMMESMDLDGLRAFVAIVDSMSFSRAGEALGRTQSAVSLRLRRLEDSLGVSLLVRRQGRIIELTPAGCRLLGYARRIIGLNDAALRDLADRDGPQRVRLGLPADFLDLGFADLRSLLHPPSADIAVEIETDVSERLRRRCDSGDLDLVIYKRTAGDDGDFLADLSMEWVAGPDFDATAHAGTLPLVCFPEGCVYRRTMLAALDHAGIPHHIVFTTAGFNTLRRVVDAGTGITALPAAALRLDNRLSVVPGLPHLENVTLAMAVAPGGGGAVRRMARRLGDGLPGMPRH